MSKVIAGNPQWVEWLEKHSITLDEVGNKSAQAFKKGSRNLNKCPVTYDHPAEAAAVDGIGPGIVKYLEKKLAEHCAYTGDAMPMSPSKKGRAAPTRKKSTKKQEFEKEEARQDEIKEARRRRTMGIAAPPGTFYRAPPGESPPPTFSDEDDRPGPSTKTKAKKAPAKKGPKSYVPKFRSGTYAILLSLYQCATERDPHRWTLKEEILQFATELCDVPFDTPSGAKGGSNDGGQAYNYSGWSSKKILIEKGLVVELNKRPKKFALTEEGFELAHTLASTAPDVATHPARKEAASLTDIAPSNPRVRPPASNNPYSDGRSNGRVRDDWGEGNILGSGDGSRSDSRIVAARGGEGGKRARVESEDEDSLFNRQLEETMQLSLRDSSETPASLSRSAGRTLGVQSSRVSDIAKKAAKGYYAGQGPSEPILKASTSSAPDAPFGYHYLDESDCRVEEKSLAEVILEEGTQKQAYRIEFRDSQKNHPMMRSVIRVEVLERQEPKSGGATSSGYLRSRVANDKCPEFAKEGSGVKQSRTDAALSLMAGYKAPTRIDRSSIFAAPASVRRPGNDRNPFSGGSDILPRSTSLKESTNHQVGESSSNNLNRTQSAPSTSRPLPGPSTSNYGSSSTSTFSYPIGKIIPTTYDPLPDQIINRHPLDPVRDHVSLVPQYFPRIKEEVWKAGTFKIVLIVDTRELGTSKANRNEIVDALKNKGVRVDRQMLPLGDMIWVARKVDQRRSPTGDDDLVLDYIVERKRLDDLCKSVQDGRYVAQKVRIKDSGISNRIYLIERYDTAALYAQYGQKIWTCKTQLQVNDGFFMHESPNIASTINFLALRTHVMTEIYEKSDLSMIPDALIDRRHYLAFQQHLRLTRPATSFLTSYKSFTKLNQSDSTLNLRIQWSAMIQSVSGLSAAKAEPFIERWPTPGIFYEDCKRRRLEADIEDHQFELANPSPTGKGKGKSKRRKAEDYVVEELGLEDLRGIREKLGATVFNLFAEKDYSKE